MATCSPIVNADTRGVIICASADMEMMPANWEIQDQACVRVDLGVLQQGETLSFDISTDSEVDILLFSSNAITVYQNEQSYRTRLSMGERLCLRGIQWLWRLALDSPI